MLRTHSTRRTGRLIYSHERGGDMTIENMYTENVDYVDDNCQSENNYRQMDSLARRSRGVDIKY